MKPQVYFMIMLRIIILFAIPISCSLFNWNIIFNDTLDTTTGRYDWNNTHIFSSIGMGCIFILSLVDATVFCVNLVNKHYPNLK